jgi:lipopolysaccharide transport system permease protein
MTSASVKHSGQYLITHWKLLWRVARTDLRARHAGSVFGIAWTVVTPLFLLGVYAAVYLLIFQIRVPGLSSSQYVLLIFSGLVPFLMTSEALLGGVSSVVASKTILSNTVFPVDLLPVKAVLISQVTMMVGLLAVVSATAVIEGLSSRLLLLPAIWALHVLALTGVVWVLSLLNLVFRDLQNLISLLLFVVMVASPIAYTPEMVPASLRPLLILNPFSYFVITYQQVLVLAQWPRWQECAVLVGMSFASFVFGGYFFTRIKRFLLDYV